MLLGFISIVVLTAIAISFITGRWIWSSPPSSPGVVTVGVATQAPSSGYNAGVTDALCKTLAGNADGFGTDVNPAWVSFLAPSGCMISTTTNVDFKVPVGWRADFVDLSGVTHSCGSSEGSGGLYGPAEGTAENAVSLWLVNSEKSCLRWTTWGQSHPGSSGSSSDSSQIVSSNASDSTSPADASEWKALVEKYGIYVSGPDEYGGIVLQLNTQVTLPDSWEAVGQQGKIAADSTQRLLTPGTWTVYPPYEWRARLGFGS